MWFSRERVAKTNDSGLGSKPGKSYKNEHGNPSKISPKSIPEAFQTHTLKIGVSE